MVMLLGSCVVVEHLGRGPTAHVVAVVSPAVVVTDQHASALALSWRMEVKRRRWNAGRQHSSITVPWKRSTTAL
jgi:hypothetical protein